MKKTIRKTICLLLCIVMVVISSFSVSSDTAKFSYVTDSEGFLIITGCEEPSAGTLTIPAAVDGKAVKSIGTGAFEGMSGVTEVIISDGICEIRESAFAGCTDLVTVTAGESLKTVGELAFSQCVNLANINMSGVESVGRNAFLSTAWYNSADINSVVYIGNVLYKYKGSMPSETSITVKEGSISISDNAFEKCLGLVSVDLPESLKYIGSSAFLNCRSLATVTAKGNIQTVGATAFNNTAWYSNQPDGVIYLGTVAIGYKTGDLVQKSIEIKEGTTSIADYAFSGFADIVSVTFAEGLQYIGRESFYGCTSLSSVDVPGSVTEIGYLAFGFYGDEQPTPLIGFIFGETDNEAALQYAATHGFNVGGTYKAGDVNLDGDTNIMDAIIIARYCSGITKMVGASLTCADANLSGDINISDAVTVARISVGLA